MAVGIQGECYIDTVAPPAAMASYNVAHESWDYTPGVMVATERSITGKLHVHRIVGGGGHPWILEEDRVMIIATLAEMLVLRSLIGRYVYYIPCYHDPLDLASYYTQCILIIPSGGVVNMDPMGSYWRIKCKFTDYSTIS